MCDRIMMPDGYQKIYLTCQKCKKPITVLKRYKREHDQLCQFKKNDNLNKTNNDQFVICLICIRTMDVYNTSMLK